MNKYMISIIITLLCSTLSFAQTLDDYFKVAAENNPGLQAMYVEYEAALQKVSQVNTLNDPVPSFGIFYFSRRDKGWPTAGKILTYTTVSVVRNTKGTRRCRSADGRGKVSKLY